MKHFVVTYDQSRGALMSLDDFADGRQAFQARLKLEEAHRGEPVEIVVLTAASEVDLKRTHRRFFQGVEGLLRVAEVKVTRSRDRMPALRARAAQ